ncbi:hypothetical protein [Hyphococcus sp. DH-69]|uniref:hypothetical protein n=1 Tax=Hyphococcus formosus TaxID=3143534 RepID=UPI00398AF9C4
MGTSAKPLHEPCDRVPPETSSCSRGKRHERKPDQCGQLEFHDGDEELHGEGKEHDRNHEELVEKAYSPQPVADHFQERLTPIKSDTDDKADAFDQPDAA